MLDLEKVIKGLEHCKADKCSGCPYEDTSAPIGKYGTDELVACEPVLFSDAITILKAQDVPDTNVGKWISVKDRLPEHGKRYLIYATSEGGKNHRITTAAYGGHFALSGRCAYWKVTHWMPLPEPPKEES